MFEKTIRDLQILERTEMEIFASGEYPTKKRTRVGHVAKWQNDGTKTIKPAKFVERARSRHRHWQSPIFKAVSVYLWKHVRLEHALNDVGLRIAYDINRVTDRIRTGRLKASMLPRIIFR